LYIDNLIESRSNIEEGLTYFIISLLGLIAVTYIGSSWIVKAIWIISTIGTLMRFIYGIVQKSESRKLEELLKKDYAKLGELI
jgi:tellurite resistance protein TehA-like permease